MEPTAPSQTLLGRLLATQPRTQIQAIRTEIVDEMRTLHTRLAHLEADLAEVDRTMKNRPQASESTVADQAPPQRNGTGPRRTGSLRSTILDVMRERPQHVWDKQEVYESIKGYDVAPRGNNPMNTLGSRLIEMARRGEIVRVGPGRFSFSEPQNDGEVPIE